MSQLAQLAGNVNILYMAADKPIEDRELVTRAQAGDMDAFERLYHMNVGRIYAVCLRMTGNATQAEELTQEAFVRAWKKLSTFQGKSRFGTWLHRVAVNVVLSGFRSDKRRRARVVTTDDLTAVETAQPTRQPGIRMDLEAAIAGLPEGARRVFVLHDVEGYRHHEIASMMGIAVGTTKAQLHRARKMLREVLA